LGFLKYLNGCLYGKKRVSFYFSVPVSLYTKQGKAAPLQAWSSPEVYRRLRIPDSMTTAQDGGKVVSIKHRPPLPPGNAPGAHLC